MRSCVLTLVTLQVFEISNLHIALGKSLDSCLEILRRGAICLRKRITIRFEVWVLPFLRQRFG